MWGEDFVLSDTSLIRPVAGSLVAGAFSQYRKHHSTPHGFTFQCARAHEILTCADMHIHIYTHRKTYKCIHTYMHTYLHTCIHAYIHTYIRKYIHTQMQTCMCIHIYVYTYIHLLAFSMCVNTPDAISIYVYMSMYVHPTTCLRVRCTCAHIYTCLVPSLLVQLWREEYDSARLVTMLFR